MLKIERYVTASPDQWDIIIEGVRNPMNSWAKSDSGYYWENGDVFYTIGRDDLALMNKLANAGSDHAKYRRTIPVWVTITAPLYWWKEFDQYKIGTTSNSCSTMHKIHAKEFTLDDFSLEHLLPDESIEYMKHLVDGLNFYRRKYLETKDKTYWWQMIQLLPSSYNQKRTIFMPYEVLANIYHSRHNHKLDEWHKLCDFIETLPYSEIITGGETPCTT